jgi:phosphatidylserine/phosphatidylglycerophosphate/cardiolipin synthase-like enzyme
LGSHAKVIAADGLRAYLGSANMTSAGYSRQFEIGAEVSGDQVREIEEILAAVDRLGVVRYEVGGV